MTRRTITMLISIAVLGCATQRDTHEEVMVELRAALRSEAAVNLNVAIRNHSRDTCFFRAPEEGVITPLVQQRIGGAWHDTLVVCFTGSRTFAVLPGETIVLKGSVPAQGLIRVGVPNPYGNMIVWSNGLRVHDAPH